MSALMYAIRRVKHVIPQTVLQDAFKPNTGPVCQRHYSLEDRIRQVIFYDRVYQDTNIVGGVTIHLDSSQADTVIQDETGAAYHFTDAVLHGREIISALSFTDGTNFTTGTGSVYGRANVGSCSNGSTLSPMLDRMTTITGGMSTPDTNIIVSMGGKNTIYVDNVYDQLVGYFRVTVSNDAELNNLQPKAWLDFANLIVYATKSYIFNQLRVLVDQGTILYGAPSNAISNIVSSYEGAEELYLESLDTFAKIAVMNDPVAHTFLIKSQISPYM